MSLSHNSNALSLLGDFKELTDAAGFFEQEPLTCLTADSFTIILRDLLLSKSQHPQCCNKLLINGSPVQFVFVSLAGWFSLFYGGYKAATGTSKPKPAVELEPTPKAGTVLKKTQEKSTSKAGDPMVKQVEEIFKKIAEKPVSKMKEIPVPKVKGEKPVAKSKVDVPTRKDERPAPKNEEETPKRKAEKQAPKKKDEKVAEQNNQSSKDKKGGYKLVKVDAER